MTPQASPATSPEERGSSVRVVAPWPRYTGPVITVRWWVETRAGAYAVALFVAGPRKVRH